MLVCKRITANTIEKRLDLHNRDCEGSLSLQQADQRSKDSVPLDLDYRNIRSTRV